MADTLTFYHSEDSKQWRWRYQAEGNYEKLANGGEEYHDLDACMRSAYRVCGLAEGDDMTAITAAAGNIFTRPVGPQVQVSVEK